MDLGTVKLRRHGINILSAAVHPRHGLCWTDGKCVWLSAVILADDPSTAMDSCIKLGEFESVCGLAWSADLSSTDACSYLCVIQWSSVSIWRVSGAVPSLNFKHVRKINATPIPQGYIWNPQKDFLCLLHRDHASLYFKHCKNKGSYALPPIESGKISCGCWSEDGKRLIIGMGSIVLIYNWIDIEKSISELSITAWKIPNIEGSVMSLVNLANHHMACTVELPLDKLCKSEDSINLFEAPDLTKSTPTSGGTGSGSDDEDDDLIIKSRSEMSLTSSLLNLECKKNIMEQYSQLVVFDLHGPAPQQPSKLASCAVSNVLSPDLLYADVANDILVVGSNTQNSLQVFQLKNNSLHKFHDIRLQEDERPKGICGSPPGNPHGTGLLAMVGKKHDLDPTFLPLGVEAEYELKLVFKALLPGFSSSHTTGNSSSQPVENNSSRFFKELQLPNGSTKVHLLRMNPIPNDIGGSDSSASDSEVSTESSASRRSKKKSCSLTDLIIPGASQLNKEKSLSRVTVLGGTDTQQELETETVSLADRAPTFAEGLDNVMRNAKQARQSELQKTFLLRSMNGSGRSSKKGSECLSVSESGSNDWDIQTQIAFLESQIRAQESQMSCVQERIDSIHKQLESTECVPCSSYRPADNPELIELVWTSPIDGCQITKHFVLDNGRLQFEPVKQAFGLSTVEILIDGKMCVVGCNIDGYIPLKFEPDSLVQVSGRRSPFADLKASKC